MRAVEQEVRFLVEENAQDVMEMVSFMRRRR
jgi:hypothetical protein